MIDHTVCTCFYLASFSQHNCFEIHACCCMYQKFIHFYYWVVFHYMHIPQFVHSPARLFSVWGCYKQSCHEQLYTSLVRTYVFIFLCKYLRVDWLGHMYNLCLTFYEIAKLFSKLIVPFYIPSAVYKSPLPPHARQHKV